MSVSVPVFSSSSWWWRWQSEAVIVDGWMTLLVLRLPKRFVSPPRDREAVEESPAIINDDDDEDEDDEEEEGLGLGSSHAGDDDGDTV